jgi:serine/threonine-protein kinase RsbW
MRSFHPFFMPNIDIWSLTGETTAFTAVSGLYSLCTRLPGAKFAGFAPIPDCFSIFAMTEHRVSYTLDSTLETVENAERSASEIAMEMGFDEDQVMQISMAVREAAINAVLHGNAYDPEKKVSLDFETNARDMIITIRDQGQGLDVDKIPDPLAPENLLKTSGRGIFLIRSFMDEVHIHPSKTGTEIKLVKHVGGPSVDGKEASQ